MLSQSPQPFVVMFDNIGNEYSVELPSGGARSDLEYLDLDQQSEHNIFNKFCYNFIEQKLHIIL